MEGINLAIQKMNESSDFLMVVYKQILGTTYLDLMKKERGKNVEYDGHSIYHLRGIRLQKDYDIIEPFCPESVGPGGYPLEESELDGNECCSTEIVVGNKETIKKYLKETKYLQKTIWDVMILGQNDRWRDFLGAVDLCFPLPARYNSD